MGIAADLISAAGVFVWDSVMQLISHSGGKFAYDFLTKALVYKANAAQSVAKMPQPKLWETRLVY
jgi:hypothetical protein